MNGLKASQVVQKEGTAPHTFDDSGPNRYTRVGTESGGLMHSRGVAVALLTARVPIQELGRRARWVQCDRTPGFGA